MDSSKGFEEGEECQSSESGWTMYIGSSHSEDDDEEEEQKENEDDEEDDEVIKENDESDDSMASDASSGPSGGVKTSGGISGNNNFKNSKGKDVSKLNKNEKTTGSLKKINRHEDSDPKNVNNKVIIRKNKNMGSKK